MSQLKTLFMQMLTTPTLKGKVMFALALIFRPMVKVRRMFFWLLIAYLTAEKCGAIVYDMYYHGQYTWTVHLIADIGMAGAVGARFYDIGWERWKGIVATLGLFVIRPAVLILLAGLHVTHLAFVQALPWYANVPMMALLVFLAIIGCTPSREPKTQETTTPESATSDSKTATPATAVALAA